MLGRKRHTHDDGDADTVVEKGPSLAKGPALAVGTILLTFGLIGLLTNADFPRDTFADGNVDGESFLGIEVNGWTNFLLIAAGGLLLFGAAQHLLAKTMSLIVGLALGAAAVISIIDGNDVFGLAATNNATKLGLAIASAVLLVNALMPRVRRTHRVETGRRDRDDDHTAVAPGERTGRFRRDRDRGREHDYEPVRDEPTRVGVGADGRDHGEHGAVAPEDPRTDPTRRGGMF